MKNLFEILKIIESATKGDRPKIRAFARQLADKIEKDGDAKAAERVRRIIENDPLNGISPANLSITDRLPVDGESRLELADEMHPTTDDAVVFLPKHVQDQVDEYLKNIEAADRLLAEGLSLSASMLLYGPPGCGKTELAKFISARLGLPLITARTDSLISSYLGSTAKNLRMLFDHASSRACVLFLDEFDAVAKLRDDRHELGELKRVVVSLLQNIDALQSQTILLAATNHEHLLDPAIWRRFSYRLRIDLPEQPVREELVEKYQGDLLSSRELKRVAMAAEGLSGSDIKEVCEGAKRRFVLEEGTGITPYVDSLKRILMRKTDIDGSDVDRLVHWAKGNIPTVYTHEVLAAMFSISKGSITNIMKKDIQNEVEI
ncbi:MAG: DNA-binding protein [Desulfovibrio sp.]|nr:DNA-binding protein [Desulfovibrio sp.]